MMSLESKISEREQKIKELINIFTEIANDFYENSSLKIPLTKNSNKIVPVLKNLAETIKTKHEEYKKLTLENETYD